MQKVKQVRHIDFMNWSLPNRIQIFKKMPGSSVSVNPFPEKKS